MKVKRPDSPRKKKKDKNKGGFYLAAALLITVVLILVFFFWHQGTFQEIGTKETQPEVTRKDDISIPDQTSVPDRVSQQSDSKSENEQVVDSDQLDKTSIVQNNKLAEDGIQTFHEGSELKENDLSLVGVITPLAEICDDSAAIIKQFYKHLDTQKYMQDYGLKTSSEEHFTALIQKLLDNPPIVSGEMNDLFAILQNTAHFFRIIGKENILILKGILDREKDEFENVLDHFYSLLHTPSCPEKSFALRLENDPLYDYAGFFLSTMGGRLYLFRRDSMSRMVVSYYAILLVDKANKNASNHHGIEIKNPINQLIAEMESTSNSLLLQEEYLDKLYTLKEEYQ